MYFSCSYTELGGILRGTNLFHSFLFLIHYTGCQVFLMIPLIYALYVYMNMDWAAYEERNQNFIGYVTPRPNQHILFAKHDN